MLALGQEGDDAASEVAYCRGFLHGADRVVTGLQHRLTADDQAKIRGWMKAMSKWRLARSQDRMMIPEFPQLEPLPRSGRVSASAPIELP